MAPRATINPISAYSIRSWPDSSLCRFFNMLIIVNISLFFRFGLLPCPSESKVSPNREGFGHSGATAMRGSKHNVAVKAPVEQGEISRFYPKVISFWCFSWVLGEEVTSQPQPDKFSHRQAFSKIDKSCSTFLPPRWRPQATSSVSRVLPSSDA